VKVLYIVGKGRSGSTLLDTTLGHIDGLWSTGELWHLWAWGLEGRHRCGCGKPVPDCPFWSAVIDRLRDEGRAQGLDELERLDARALLDRQQRVMSWPSVPRLLLSQSRGSQGWRDLERHVAVLGALYRAVGAVSGARVIVDSSKFPAHPGLLGLVPGIEPHLVQLVRDPRAVTYSYRRLKVWPDRDPPEPMPRFGPTYSATSWIARNVATNLIRSRLPRGRSTVVRYEQFVASPAPTLRAIARLVGEEPSELPVIGQNRLRLTPRHTVGGNPDRFNTGSVQLREDDEWRRAGSGYDRAITTLLTAPLLPTYGYPVRTTRP